MSQKLIQKPLASHSPAHRTKSPIYLSPNSNRNQSLIVSNKYPSSNFNPTTSELTLVNENNIKNVPNAPLEFSAGRKLKNKCPQVLGNIASFLSGGPVGFGGQSKELGAENLAARFNNENRHAWQGQARGQLLEVAKIRSHYEGQIKVIRENHKNMQMDLDNKCKNLEKQKNYWKDSFMIIKLEYDSIVRSKEKQQKKYQTQIQPPNQTHHQSQIVELEQKLKKLQLQIQKRDKSYKQIQTELGNVRKQKQDMGYQNNFFREESRKANARIFEIQYDLEVSRREIAELKQQLSKRDQEQNGLSRSMDLHTNTNNSGLTLSFEQPTAQCHRKSHSGSKSKNSSSLSLNSSGSGKHRSSRHHRSHSNSSSHSVNQYHPHQPQIIQLQPNVDLFKEIQRFRHSCRKLQKTICNQNSNIMSQGLRKLNSKYAKMYAEEVEDQNKCIEGEEMKKNSTAYFRFPGANQNGGKGGSMRFI